MGSRSSGTKPNPHWPLGLSHEAPGAIWVNEEASGDVSPGRT